MVWLRIIRLGLVQMSLGALVVLTTATLNRVMVVELALPALLPGLLVSLYYGLQFLRPRFGHGADQGGRRVPWILGGVAVLAAGGLIAAHSVGVMAQSVPLGIAVAIPAFVLIGLGIGAAGTNVLALLSAIVPEGRQAEAGSTVWIMMIAGLATTGITAGILLDPFSQERLMAVASGVAAIALVLSVIGAYGQDRGVPRRAPERKIATKQILAELWGVPHIRTFTIFVFASMLAYNLQDLILEPFGGHVFGMSVGESTALGGQLHAGALSGMILVLIATPLLRVPVRVWIVGGCVLSGAALLAMGFGAQTPHSWPIGGNVFVLGLANGAFAVAAVGAMMGLAREGSEAREGARMGLFGAAQAIAFGAGSFLGTAAVDVMRALTPSLPTAYGTVFIAEGTVFLLAAFLALKIGSNTRKSHDSALVPGE
ncbi:MAG: BCD family MFS transporter [Pseudomonadota bacterium]